MNGFFGVALAGPTRDRGVPKGSAGRRAGAPGRTLRVAVPPRAGFHQPPVSGMRLLVPGFSVFLPDRSSGSPAEPLWWDGDSPRVAPLPGVAVVVVGRAPGATGSPPSPALRSQRGACQRPPVQPDPGPSPQMFVRGRWNRGRQ